MANGEYINLALRKFDPAELIQVAEHLTSNKSGLSLVMKRIFERIEQERNENEYNRTKILAKGDLLGGATKDLAFDINSSGGLRLLEKADSVGNKGSYMNDLAKNNEEHLKRATN